jgi:hypothetical protein
MEKSGKASNAVPAHLGFRSVRVVEDHPEPVRPTGRNQDQSISPHPEMPVADSLGQIGWIDSG